MPTREPADRPLPTACSTVLFDGSCPLCSREIAIYSILPARIEMQWVDVSAPDYNPTHGTTRTQLMQRFHASTGHGELLSGAGISTGNSTTTFNRWQLPAQLRSEP